MILTGHVSVTESCCFIHVWDLGFEWQTAGMQNQLEKEKEVLESVLVFALFLKAGYQKARLI